MTVAVKSAAAAATGGLKGRGGGGAGRGRTSEERTSAGGAVTRTLAATRTMTISFYFLRSFVSLAQTFNFYFYRRPCHFFVPPSPPTHQPGSTARLHQPSHRDILECISRSGDLFLLFRAFVSVILYRLQVCASRRNCKVTSLRNSCNL